MLRTVATSSPLCARCTTRALATTRRTAPLPARPPETVAWGERLISCGRVGILLPCLANRPIHGGPRRSLARLGRGGAVGAQRQQFGLALGGRPVAAQIGGLRLGLVLGGSHGAARARFVKLDRRGVHRYPRNGHG